MSKKHKKCQAAVSMGKRGGKARALALTPQERSEIAKKAAMMRWGRYVLDKIRKGDS